MPLNSFQVVKSFALVGVPYAITFADAATIYVSPAIFSLMQNGEIESVLAGLHVAILITGKRRVIGKHFMKHFITGEPYHYTPQ